MKVKYENTTEYKLAQFIDKSSSDVILREDLKSLGSERQISRAISALTKKNKIAKISYGVYVRLKYSKTYGRTYLPKGLVSLMREALTKIGIKWEPSEAEKAYNDGRSQQIPANPRTKLLERFRRKFSYNGMELYFE